MKALTLLLLAAIGIFKISFKPRLYQNLTFNQANYKTLSVQDTTLSQSIKRGEGVYQDFCMQCHLDTGKGVAGTYPPLAGSDYLLKNRLLSIKAVKYGMSGKITVNGSSYNSIMPNPGLYPDEIADVMNYILHSWKNTSDEMVTEREVEAVDR